MGMCCKDARCLASLWTDMSHFHSQGMCCHIWGCSGWLFSIIVSPLVQEPNEPGMLHRFAQGPQCRACSGCKSPVAIAWLSSEPCPPPPGLHTGSCLGQFPGEPSSVHLPPGCSSLSLALPWTSCWALAPVVSLVRSYSGVSFLVTGSTLECWQARRGGRCPVRPGRAAGLQKSPRQKGECRGRSRAAGGWSKVLILS